jgi:predicted HTH transcriptional regulator
LAEIIDPKRLLDTLRAQPRENEWLEFKVNDFEAKRCAEYISGLANSAMLQGKPHAYLCFGVEDDTHAVVGTAVNLKTEKVGAEPFENWVSRKLDPRLNLTIIPFDYGGKHVEIIAIEPAYQRPVRVDGEAFIRIDSQLRRLQDYPERERSIWMIASRFVFEHGVAAVHRASVDIFRDYDISAFLKLVGKPNLSDKAKLAYLESSGMILDDLQGAYDVTNLCAILCADNFGAHASISTKAPRVTTYAGTDRLKSVGDDIGKRGYAVTFPRLLKYIIDRTPFREEMRHGVRTKVLSYPEIAVREFLANALIHQDFTLEAGCPLVEIFEDRLQITNPGTPLVEVDRFIDSPSKTRNTKLALMMRSANLCEARGSGVDRALQAIEADALPPPVFRLSGNSTVVTLFKEQPFAALSKDDRIRGCYQHASLRYEANDPMSNGSLRIRFGLTAKQYPQISEVISDAIVAGLIRPLHEDQGNRTARYLPFWA